MVANRVKNKNPIIGFTTMKIFDRIKSALDKPLVWFIFILWLGLIIVEESSSEFSSALIFIFAVLVWEYERRKRGK